MTDDEEQDLGAAVSERIRKKYGVVQDPAIHKYVTLVGSVLAQASSRPEPRLEVHRARHRRRERARRARRLRPHHARRALADEERGGTRPASSRHEIIHVTEKHTIRAIQKGKMVQMGADETAQGQQGALRSARRTRPTRSSTPASAAATNSSPTARASSLANKVGYAPSGLAGFLTTAQRSQQGLHREAGALRVAPGDEGAPRQARRDHQEPEARRPPPRSRRATRRT